ncbi:ribonuclease III [Patescibacteria group bacterium]|nr:ribonuclease III [Patescibacteria group bacterium]MBU1472420.1 ribonuclease III [Patescibacteria group bacterium]MBU2460235.1 ribonuclease III [Patescibacteria group bacterium]MBU2544560.1 ribonuclease III [Patescibacteria group bacterium]
MLTFEGLQKTIGIRFRDQKLLKEAFIHRSYLNESKQTKESNERLEFLGDSVLSFLTSHFLYEKYPNYPEGILTNIRSSLVKTKSLSDAAKSIGLGDLLYLSRGEEDSGGRSNASLLADVFEALLGAIYLDQGTNKAQQFLQTCLFPKAKDIVDQKAYIDYKSHLQEIVQEKVRISPLYRVVKSEGPDHNKIFWVEAVVDNEVIGRGSGKSKQEAEQAAALAALERKYKS